MSKNTQRILLLLCYDFGAREHEYGRPGGSARETLNAAVETFPLTAEHSVSGMRTVRSPPATRGQCPTAHPCGTTRPAATRCAAAGGSRIGRGARACLRPVAAAGTPTGRGVPAGTTPPAGQSAGVCRRPPSTGGVPVLAYRLQPHGHADAVRSRPSIPATYYEDDVCRTNFTNKLL